VLRALPDNAHVLTTCDASWDTNNSSVCDRQVYHLDGSVVTQQAPAAAGETIYVLLYGLGRTDPNVATGQASSAGVAITDPVPNFRRLTLGIVTHFVNSLSSTPRTTFNPDTANASFVPVTSASLLSGQIGIYQVSFTIPAVTESNIPCIGAVRSNSILLVTTSQGVESIALCVQR
jgi:hypothetical protein